jgi:hypothetical protein
MKFITLNGTQIFPFDPAISHDKFFHTVAGRGDSCTGAGFIFLEEDRRPVCYGHSVSLDISATPRDTLLAEIVFMAARRRIAGM